MLLRRITPATARPVMMAEARDHCRGPAAEDDDVLAGFVQAALTMVGEMSGRVLAPETWAASFPYVCGDLKLPKAPVIEVVSITYFDAADVQRTATLADFYVFADEDSCVIRPKAGRAWPTTIKREDAVTVTFEAGYETIPDPLKTAVLMLVGHLYENREAATVGAVAVPVPFGVQEMVGLYRLGWVAG